MLEVSPDELKQAVEVQHGGEAVYAGCEPVKETFNGEIVWEGIVHSFVLIGNPKAKFVYAWSAPIEGSTKRRFYAVLAIPPVNSAVDAVRAAIVADHRGKTGSGEMPKHDTAAVDRFLRTLPGRKDRE